MRSWSEEELEDSLRRGDASVSDGPTSGEGRESATEGQPNGAPALASIRGSLPDGIEETLLESQEPTIGIDPGAETGVVLYDEAGGKILEVMNATFWQAAILMAISSELGVTLWAYIEDPNLNNFTYRRHNLGGAKRDKLNRNVGRNQAFGELLVEGAELMGHVVRAVKPQSEKWDDEKCNQITGYPLVNDNPYYNNQHVRDAIRCLYRGGVIQSGDLEYLEG